MEALPLDVEPPGQGRAGLQLDPRKPQLGITDWLSSLQKGAGAPAPSTPQLGACSPEHIPHTHTHSFTTPCKGRRRKPFH